MKIESTITINSEVEIKEYMIERLRKAITPPNKAKIKYGAIIQVILEESQISRKKITPWKIMDQYPSFLEKLNITNPRKKNS